jgi:hypothetical protein
VLDTADAPHDDGAVHPVRRRRSGLRIGTKDERAAAEQRRVMIAAARANGISYEQRDGRTYAVLHLPAEAAPPIARRGEDDAVHHHDGDVHHERDPRDDRRGDRGLHVTPSSTVCLGRGRPGTDGLPLEAIAVDHGRPVVARVLAEELRAGRVQLDGGRYRLAVPLEPPVARGLAEFAC